MTNFNEQPLAWRKDMIRRLAEYTPCQVKHSYVYMQNFPAAWQPTDIEEVCVTCGYVKEEDNKYISQWDTLAEMNSQVL